MGIVYDNMEQAACLLHVISSLVTRQVGCLGPEVRRRAGEGRGAGLGQSTAGLGDPDPIQCLDPETS